MRPYFEGDLILRVWTAEELRLAGISRQRYDLRSELAYVSPKFGKVVAPVGLCTDFASVPRFAWRYIDPEDPVILMPSVIHDWLYSTAGLMADGTKLSREQVDELFIEAMQVCGARWDQLRVVHWAVRIGGGSHWNGEN